MATVSEILLEQGRRAGETRRRQGETSAQLWSGLGQIAGQTIGTIEKEREQAPIRAQESTLRDLQAQAARGTIAENAAQTAALTRQAGDQTAMDTAIGSGLDLPSIERALQESGSGHLIPTVRKSWNDAETAAANLKTAKAKAEDAEKDYWGALAAGVQPHLGEADGGMGAAKIALQHAKQNGYADADSYLEQIQDPQHLATAVQGMIAASPTYSKLAGESQDRTLRQQQEQRAILTQQQAQADRMADNTRADATQAEAVRHNRVMEARPVAGAASGDEAEAIADAIIRGEQSPETTGLYRVGPQVRAQLAKKGYNQAQAITDWKATQKHIATLNGAQQTRMSQAVDNAAHSLDVIDDLAGQWNAGKFPLLNKARLVVAKQGGLGPQAQQIATALDAQISDITSELGNVYMGGNSPTDHALSLAAKNLSADWSADTLKAMTKQARTNLQIRQNSMRNVGVAGASAGNAYAPQQPSGRIVVTAPDGSTHPFDTQAQADAFKKLAGIK